MSADWWMVFVTCGLLVVAAVQAGMFFWQLRLLRATAADTAKSADAAEKAANAALGVELPRLELGRVYRSIEGRSEPHADTEMKVTVNLSNRGRNEAVIVESCGAMILKALPEAAVYPRNGVRRAAVGDIVRPEGGFRVDFPNEGLLPQIAADKVLKGEKLWVVCYVLYRDFLGNHWISKFCLCSGFSPENIPTLIESYDYPHYTGREAFDPTKPRTDLVDDMPLFPKRRPSDTGNALVG